MASEFDYLKALTEAHASGQGGWRILLALEAVIDYLELAKTQAELDEDGVNILSLIEQCLVTPEVENDDEGVVRFTMMENEDGEWEAQMTEPSTPAPAPAAKSAGRQITAEEIKKFTEMLGGIPTAPDREKNNDGNRDSGEAGHDEEGDDGGE